MPKVLGIREENQDEKALREWFEAQKLEAPKSLEEAARLIIGLVSGLLAALLGILTLAAEQPPLYLALPLVRWLAALAVVLWLLTLLTGLVVLVPLRWRFSAGKPGSERATFEQILAHKRGWLTLCFVTFWLGVLCLGGVLLTAIFSAG